jgi:seryl-tRNA synthetase
MINDNPHDVVALRADPEGFDRALALRGHPACAARLLEIDDVRVAAIRRAEAARNHVASFGGKLGKAKAFGDAEDIRRVMAELSEARADSSGLQREEIAAEDALRLAMLEVPCLPAPVSGNDATWNRPLQDGRFEHAVVVADDLGWCQVTGVRNEAMHRQALFSGKVAAMQRAVGQLAAEAYAEAGLLEVAPPGLEEGQSSLGRPTAARRVSDAVEPLFAVLRSGLHRADMPFAIFALCGERRERPGPQRDRGSTFVPPGPSISILHADFGEGDAADAAFAPARAILDGLGIAHRTLEVEPRRLDFHAARTLVLEGWHPAGGGHAVEVGRVSDTSDYLSRRMDLKAPKGAPRRFPRIVLGSPLFAGTVTALAVEANQSGRGIEVPAPLERFTGTGPIGPRQAAG